MNYFLIMLALVAWVASLGQALATKVLVPIYVYPDPGVWDNLDNAIANNPTLTFQVIINPGDGPGSSTPGFDSNWRTAVSTLNSHSNVETYGYVHTMHGAESTSAVEANITIWETWNTYTAQDISMTGIFFDEVPDGQTAYMTTLTNFAHSTLGSSSKIIFNPGAAVTGDDYFKLADNVVVFEDSASNYDTSIPTSRVSSQYASKASILVYSYAGSQAAAKSELQSWLAGMVKANIGSVNVVDDGWSDDSTANAPADIGDVAGLLVAAQ